MSFLDAAEARLKLITALKEEFMDIVDDGTTGQSELTTLDLQMTDMAVDILDAFKMEILSSPEHDVFDVRLRVPNYGVAPATSS